MEKAAARLAVAREAVARAAAAAAGAEEESTALRRTHAAHDLRAHLVPGADCPVCAQSVAAVPAPGPAPAAIAAAEQVLAAARERARAADLDVARIETALAKEEERAKQLARDAARRGADEDAAAATLEAYLGTTPTSGTRAALESALAELEAAADAAATADADARRAAEEAAAAHREQDRLFAARDAEAGAAAERAQHRARDERELGELRERLAAVLGQAADAEPSGLVAAARDALAAARRARDEHAALVERRDALKRDLEDRRAEEIATRSVLAASELSGAAARTAAEAASARATVLRADLATRAGAIAIALPASADGAAERAAVEARRGAAATERADLAASRAVAELERAEIERAQARRSEAARERDAAAGAHALARQLATDLQADRFVTYLHEEAVAVLAADANRHLKDYLGMDFSLEVENRRFTIIDHANADERRSVRTLSGGESFTASLALAIAFAERLAELAGAASRPHALESLFLDEGFGTLDEEHLDHVANAIEALYGRGRTVGIITHIRELAQRMPARIVVAKQGNASAVVIETG